MNAVITPVNAKQTGDSNAISVGTLDTYCSVQLELEGIQAKKWCWPISSWPTSVYLTLLLGHRMRCTNCGYTTSVRTVGNVLYRAAREKLSLLSLLLQSGP